MGKCRRLPAASLNCYLARTSIYWPASSTWAAGEAQCEPPEAFDALLRAIPKQGRLLRGAMAELGDSSVQFCGLPFKISRDVFCPRKGGHSTLLLSFSHPHRRLSG